MYFPPLEPTARPLIPGDNVPSYVVGLSSMSHLLRLPSLHLIKTRCFVGVQGIPLKQNISFHSHTKRVFSFSLVSLF
jgi:hypothetical protein